jgi:predicted permease
MQPDLFNVISTVASVFLVMSTGALARRWKVFERDVDRSLAVLTKSILMPAATFPIVMTRLFDQDVETAWIVVVGTSAFTMVTIPLWLLFAPAYG